MFLQMNMKPRSRRLREYRAFMIPSSVLILLGLLYLCVHGFQGNVNPAALSKIIQYFDDNVQPKTKTGTDAQYAIAIIVPQAHCTEEGSDIQNVFSREDAENVRNLLTNRVKCVLCTPSQNVIAARPTQKPKEHAEHVLLYPLGNSPMDKLLAQADQNSCVVFYSYNSPCVTKCIQSADSILDGLINWTNKRIEAMNVFVFKKIWWRDAWRKDIDKEFQKIDEKVPLYRCNKTDVMGCNKCVENSKKVVPFCLSD